MKKLILLLCFPCFLIAQDCDNYDNLIKEAKKLSNQKAPNYQKALQIYNAARIAAKDCGQDKDQAVNKAIASLFDLIDGQRKKAEKAEAATAKALQQVQEQQEETEKAMQAMIKARDAAKEAAYKRNIAEKEKQAAQKGEQNALALAEKRAAEAERGRAKAVVIAENALNALDESARALSGIYFYGGRMAISKDVDKNTYGIITKEGNPITAKDYKIAPTYNSYTECFEGKKHGKEYRINEYGEFLCATSIAAITSETECLDLSRSRLMKFPMKIFDYPHLKALILSNNYNLWGDIKSFGDVPDKIGTMVNLEVLILNNHFFKTLPSSIGNLKELRYLNIDQSDFKTLPDEITKLTKLKCLDLSNSDLEGFPTDIGKMKSLERIFVQSSYVKVLPSSIGDLKELKVLDLTSSSVNKIPSTIGKLTNLEHLLLSAIYLDGLAPEIRGLKKIKSLDLSYSNLKELPTSIGELSNLYELNLSEIRAKELPKSMENLVQLGSLNLMYSNLDRLVTIPNLRKLDLAFSKLTNIEEDLGKLTSLKHLELTFNEKMTKVPDSVRKLKKLEILAFTGCTNLKELPEWLTELEHLEYLYVERCGLSKEAIKAWQKKLPECTIVQK